MAAACSGDVDVLDGNQLSAVFNKAENIVWSVESGEYKCDNQYQETVLNAKKLLENATQMVSQLGIFSSNESIEDIATADIRYLLLPAYLGCITLKLNNADRTKMIDISEAYFQDFIKRCQLYNVIDDKTLEEKRQPKSHCKVQNDMVQLTKQREAKIAKFKRQKERDNEIQNLKTAVEKSHTDDEVKRNYYILLVEKWLDTSFEEIDNLSLEKKFLEMKPEFSSKKIEPVKTEPLKPIIITKNDLQKKVFGAGYPSIPTMTLDEFYDQEVKKGRLPGSTSTQSKNNSSSTDDKCIKVEQSEETDDPDELKKKREMDDWKDDHRRGWGNRKNKS